MNLHNFAKVFSYCKSHLNYVDLILPHMPNESRNVSQCAAGRYATLFFLTPHYTYHTWAVPRPCPCRSHVSLWPATKATTKCCYEMKIFLKFLDPKANSKSSETQSHRTSVGEEGGGGEWLARGCVLSC